MADYGCAISLAQGRDLSPNSDDDDSDHSHRSVPTLSGGGGGGGGSSSSKPRKSASGAAGEFTSPVEIQKKPRGRPPGSKNKPKPPIVITKDNDLAMKPVILEISAGSDVVESLIQFARRKHVGITVLSGCGSVSNVTLRHPLSHAPLLSLHGPFNLLSISGTFVGGGSSISGNASSSSAGSSKPSSCTSSLLSSCSSFGISLAGAQGQVFGGVVGGKVTAASAVVVVAATFQNPSFHRVPGETDHHHLEVEETKPGSHGGGGGNEASSGMSMSVYSVASPAPINCQISPDVMAWGPNSRSPY